MLKAIVEANTVLLNYSIAIRKASKRDLFARAAGRTTMPDIWDINHVRERWPKLREQEWLADRLGSALTRRRQNFNYRREHREKLSSGIEDKHAHGKQSTKATTLIETQAVTLNAQQGEESDTGFSQTTFQTTFESDVQSLRVPSAPSESDGGKPFECPFCYSIIRIRGRTSWK